MNFNKTLRFSFAACLILSLAACEKDDSNEPQLPDIADPVVSEGIFVLNQGNYYAGIEGSLNIIEYNSAQSRQNVFLSVNGRTLGSTPQCGLAYGSKIYLGIFESNTIEIIDRSNYKSLKQIPLNGSPYPGTQPRSMVASDGKVYISMFDGYVARLDTVTMQIDASVKVGPNPEIMTLHKGKLYVPNSDGMSTTGFGTTASEINLATFSVSQTFKVPVNPARFYSNGSELFLLCNGNYYDEDAKLYKINPDFSNVSIDNATLAEICGNYICYVNDPFYGNGQADYKKYDITSGEISNWNIDRPEYASNIYYDPVAEKISIFSLKYYGGIWPSYELPGYVAVYDKDGNHLRNYDCGVGPACIFGNAK